MPYCTKCGMEVVQGSSFCSGCGNKLLHVSDTEHASAHSALADEEYAIFVGKNAGKYLPAFGRFSVGGVDNFKLTWHWPAFLVPFLWLAYRKLYIWAVLAFFVDILFCVGLLFVGLPLRIVWGLTAKYIYYKHATKKLIEARQIHASSETRGP